MELAEEMKQEGISFSDTALEELNEMSTTTLGAYDNAVKALELDDVTYAVKTSFLEDQVDAMERSCAQGISSVCPMRNAVLTPEFTSLDLWGIWNVFPTMHEYCTGCAEEHRAENEFP